MRGKAEEATKIFSTFFEKPIDKPRRMCYNNQVAWHGPIVKRLRRRPLTAKAWVRFPLGSPKQKDSLRLSFCFGDPGGRKNPLQAARNLPLSDLLAQLATERRSRREEGFRFPLRAHVCRRSGKRDSIRLSFCFGDPGGRKKPLQAARNLPHSDLLAQLATERRSRREEGFKFPLRAHVCRRSGEHFRGIIVPFFT